MPLIFICKATASCVAERRLDPLLPPTVIFLGDKQPFAVFVLEISYHNKSQMNCYTLWDPRFWVIVQRVVVMSYKTKYMRVARAVRNDEHLCCGQHKFEHVKEISYLGLQMNQTNSISGEIQARILSGNRCCYGCGKLMKSRALTL